MILLHRGFPKGAELIAANWASNRNVPQELFRPDWAKHKNAAPSSAMTSCLRAMAVGVVVFPGNGVSRHLANKPKKLGISVMRFDRDSA